MLAQKSPHLEGATPCCPPTNPTTKEQECIVGVAKVKDSENAIIGLFHTSRRKIVFFQWPWRIIEMKVIAFPK